MSKRTISSTDSGNFETLRRPRPAGLRYAVELRAMRAPYAGIGGLRLWHVRVFFDNPNIFIVSQSTSLFMAARDALRRARRAEDNILARKMLSRSGF